MTQTLNLSKDNPLGSSNGQNNFNNNSNEKKNSSPKKIIIGIIVAILIVLALVVTFCFYKNNSEVNAFNRAISKLNGIQTSISKTGSNVTADELSSYATSLNNLSGEFNIFSKETFLGKENRLKAKNYSDVAKYASYKETFSISLLKLVNELNGFGSPGPSQIQDMITNWQNLLSTDDFIQMSNIYNQNPFVQNKINSSISPVAIKNSVNTIVNKLSNYKNAENLVNDLDSAFGQDSEFGYNPFYDISSNSSNSNNNTNSNSADTSVPTAYPSSEDEAADNSSSSTPGYMQTLHSLSGKYQDLISNAIDQFGHGNGGNLILGDDPSSNSSQIQSYYNTWDSILNNVWQDLEANLPSNQMTTLTAEETDWINSKKGKSPGEVAQMTKDRAMLLINKYITQSN